MKRIAQIAYEAAWPEGPPEAWFREPGKMRERWFAAAQAVRQAVLEEAAKVCDDNAQFYDEVVHDVGPLLGARYCASKIRELK